MTSKHEIETCVGPEIDLNLDVSTDLVTLTEVSSVLSVSVYEDKPFPRCWSTVFVLRVRCRMIKNTTVLYFHWFDLGVVSLSGIYIGRMGPRTPFFVKVVPRSYLSNVLMDLSMVFRYETLQKNIRL